MVWKFFIGVAIFGNSYPIGVRQAPSIIVNPFHESIACKAKV